MENKPKNINAFPGKEESAFGQDTGHYYGMTLRDYFAAKVMQGVQSSLGTHRWSVEKFVNYSYEVADAMLNQREQ